MVLKISLQVGFFDKKNAYALTKSLLFDFENGFTTDEVGGILALQKAIKNHSTYAFLMGGADQKPEKKEVKRNADDGRTEGAGIRTETYENEGY